MGRLGLLLFASLFLAGSVFSNAGGQVSEKRLKSTNYHIAKITVEGNQSFSKKSIQNQTSFARPSWWQFPASFFALFSKPRLNAKLVATDEFAVDSLYHINGFWGAMASITWTETGKNKVEVTITIREGVRTILTDAKLAGGFPEFNPGAAKALRRLKLNQPFDKTKLDEAVFEVKKIYADRGYPYAEVEAIIEQTQDSTGASVQLNISPDGQVFFGDTEISGLNHTREYVVRRELAFKPGEVYSREKLIESRQRIYSTGLFSFVTLEANQAAEKPTRPNFNLRLVERKSNYFRFGFLAGQSLEQDLTSDLSATYGNRNWFGTGRRYSLSVGSKFALLSKFQYLGSRFSLKYYQPRLLGLRFPLDLDGYYEPGAKSVTQPYRVEQFGANINLRRELRKYTELWLTGSYQHVNIYGIDASQEDIFKEERGISIRRKVGVSLHNDTRSNHFIPTGGSQTILYLEFFGGILGGDHNFLKTTVSWSRYLQPQGSTRLRTWAFRVKLGRAIPYTANDFVPRLDRFYLGGASSIRGYTENTLGPKDSTGIAEGGTILGLANLEYREGLFWKLGWSIFLDYGNIWLETREVGFNSLRLSGGAGLQFFSPLGPIRLDYGRKLLAGDKALRGGRLHLSILYAF